jgi:hypothetical protein
MNELIEIFSMNYDVTDATYLARMAGYKYTIGLYSVHAPIDRNQEYWRKLWSVHI